MISLSTACGCIACIYAHLSDSYGIHGLSVCECMHIAGCAAYGRFYAQQVRLVAGECGISAHDMGNSRDFFYIYIYTHLG